MVYATYFWWKTLEDGANGIVFTHITSISAGYTPQHLLNLQE